MRQVEAEVAKGVQSEMPRTAEAGRKLLLAACQALEEEAMATLVGRVQRVKVRPLDMLTRFGWVRLGRQQVVERRLRRYTYPLDEVLKLEPRQHASPWVVAQAAALATRTPYRQATRLLVEMLEATVDHRTVYAWVQSVMPQTAAAGAQVAAEEDEEQEAVPSLHSEPALSVAKGQALAEARRRPGTRG